MKTIRNIAFTVPDVANVLFLLACSMGVFSLFALKMFQKDPQSKERVPKWSNGDSYFQSYPNVIWHMYVLVTTANNPDVSLPARDEHSAYEIFFLIYILINLYLFMSILLAVIYNSYKERLKEEVLSIVKKKQQNLLRAFDLIKSNVKGFGECVTLANFYQLMKGIIPDITQNSGEFYFWVLDINLDGVLVKKEFFKVADLLNTEVKEAQDLRPRFARLCPNFYYSKFSGFFVRLHHSIYYKVLIDGAIIANAIVIGLQIEQAEHIFVALFTFEVVLGIYAEGPKVYLSRFFDAFDTILICCSLLVNILSIVNEDIKKAKFVLMLRVLRLLRLTNKVKGFRIVAETIANIKGYLLIYSSVLFLFYYLYALIGMAILSHTIREHRISAENYQYWPGCNNSAPRMNTSDFYNLGYCSVNFNNILRAYGVLFIVTVVNQWHAVTDGFAFAVGCATSNWQCFKVRLYFMSFHLIGVFLLMNIFQAFILEVFFIEYTTERNRLYLFIEALLKKFNLIADEEELALERQTKREAAELAMEQRKVLEIKGRHGGSLRVRHSFIPAVDAEEILYKGGDEIPKIPPSKRSIKDGNYNVTVPLPKDIRCPFKSEYVKFILNKTGMFKC